MSSTIYHVHVWNSSTAYDKLYYVDFGIIKPRKRMEWLLLTGIHIDWLSIIFTFTKTDIK
jgi:hypothetical protein